MTDDEIRKLCAEATESPSDDGEGPKCNQCGDTYAMESGLDPTPLCDRCAHVASATLAEGVTALLTRTHAAEAEAAKWYKAGHDTLDVVMERLEMMTRARDEACRLLATLSAINNGGGAIIAPEELARLRSVGKAR